GVDKFAILTGDAEPTAKAVAEQLGSNEVHAGLLPKDKVELVSNLAPHPTMMVGDGINDAPVLAATDVGVALGVRGPTAAGAAADAVILQDSLSPGRGDRDRSAHAADCQDRDHHWYRDVGRSDVGGRVRLHSGGRWCTSPGGRGPRGNPVRAAGAPGASGRSRRFRAALASPLVLRLLPMLGRCARSAGFWPGRYSGIHNGTTAAGRPRTGNQPQLFLEKHRNLGLNSRSD